MGHLIIAIKLGALLGYVLFLRLASRLVSDTRVFGRRSCYSRLNQEHGFDVLNSSPITINSDGFLPVTPRVLYY